MPQGAPGELPPGIGEVVTPGYLSRSWAVCRARTIAVAMFSGGVVDQPVHQVVVQVVVQVDPGQPGGLLDHRPQHLRRSGRSM